MNLMDISAIALMMPPMMPLARKVSFDSMNEGTNEKENGEEEEEHGDNENKKKNSCIPSKGRFA